MIEECVVLYNHGKTYKLKDSPSITETKMRKQNLGYYSSNDEPPNTFIYHVIHNKVSNTPEIRGLLCRVIPPGSSQLLILRSNICS